MLYQEWRDCSFLHWSFEPAALRPHIPRGFELDLHGGRAWASLISFRIRYMRAGPLPPIPGLSSALESHLRIYVQGPDGRRGIWMVSLDIDPLAAAAAGRFGFALPYWWGDMEVDRQADSVRYMVRRRGGRAARLDLELALGETIDKSGLTELDHYLTARWVLYGGARRVRTAILTQHPRWTFRRVDVRRLEQNVLHVDGLPAVGAPEHAHFSDGVDARLGWPQPLLVRNRRDDSSISG
jgi:uncharacterized protein YqjF (DUF2071 family)